MSWVPSPEDLQQIFREQNPWHKTGRVPQSLSRPRRRPLADLLWRVLLAPRLDRYQVVIGPRRVGKTVTMYQTVERLIEEGIDVSRLWWLHMAHPILMQMDLGDLVRSILRSVEPKRELPAFIFLDELTYAREWDAWLKTFFDERRPLRIVGTSSSTAALQRGRIESGVGRWEEQYLPPCLFNEYLHLRGNPQPVSTEASLAQTLLRAASDQGQHAPLHDEMVRYLLVGGFPELLTGGRDPGTDLFGGDPDLASAVLESQRVLRSDAVQKAIYQDIPQVFGLDAPLNLERLLYTLAGQVCGILSASTIATDVGNTVPTVEKYLGYLEQSHLVFTLPNYAPREESVQRRGRRLYFVDGAVRNAALQRGIVPLDRPDELGLLFENAAAGHLHALSQQTGNRIYHWRQRKLEVDLVYDDPAGPLAFEIGSSPRHSTSGLVALAERYPKFRGGCYLVYPDAPLLPPSAESPDGGRLPLELFLVLVGAQAEKETLRRLSV